MEVVIKYQAEKTTFQRRAICLLGVQFSDQFVYC